MELGDQEAEGSFIKAPRAPIAPASDAAKKPNSPEMLHKHLYLRLNINLMALSTLWPMVQSASLKQHCSDIA